MHDLSKSLLVYLGWEVFINTSILCDISKQLCWRLNHVLRTLHASCSKIQNLSIGRNQLKLVSWILNSAPPLKVYLTPKYFFSQINLCTCLKCIAPFCPFLTQILAFYRLKKLRNLAIICCTTEQDLMRCPLPLIPCPLLAQSCDRWWLDFVTFSLKRRSAIRTGAKIYLSEKNILGLCAL